MNTNNKLAPVILLAEDDPEDRMITIKAFQQALLINQIYTVEDGEDLMDYLLRRGKYSEAHNSPRPVLILLDLNMPRKDGRQALLEIKSHSALRRIPVIVLTTSQAEEDIVRSYDLGVNSFITKPVNFQDFLKAVKTLGQYWLELVTLPPEPMST